MGELPETITVKELSVGEDGGFKYECTFPSPENAKDTSARDAVICYCLGVLVGFFIDLCIFS